MDEEMENVFDYIGFVELFEEFVVFISVNKYFTSCSMASR
jgi:hypothetical protein